MMSIYCAVCVQGLSANCKTKMTETFVVNAPVCVCVCVCARSRARVCVGARARTLLRVYVCVQERVRAHPSAMLRT